MRLLGSAPLPLDQRLPLDAALDEAFAPLRARTANIGPARIRAAVRWTAPEPRTLGGLALFTRVSELTVAAAISAFLFAGTVVSPTVGPATTELSRDAATSATRVLNGRLAFQPPIESHAADSRMAAGEFAANAATSRRPEAAAPAQTIRDSEPFAGRP